MCPASPSWTVFRRGVVGALAALVVAAPGPAHAEAGSSEGAVLSAEALDARARDAFNEGDYQAALDALRVAQGVAPASPRLYNMAQCHEGLGQNDDALTLYRQYLEATDTAPGRRRLAEQRVESLSRPAQSVADVTVPSISWVDVREVDASNRLRGPFWGMVATTSLLTAGAVVLGAVTLARHVDFTERFQEDPEVPHLSDVGQALALSTDIMVALAAASAIVTLVVGLVWRHRRIQQRRREAAVGSRPGAEEVAAP
jgi:tetratricopeptide (TPR) repeat protein